MTKARNTAIAQHVNSLLVALTMRMKARIRGDDDEVRFWLRQEIRAENELRILEIPMHGTLVPEDLPR